MSTRHNTKEIIIRILHNIFWFIVVCTFIIGAISMDSLAEQGKEWLMLVLIVLPAIVGWAGVKWLNMGKYL